MVSGALFDPNAMSGCPPHPTTKGSEFSFDVVMVDDDPSLRLNKVPILLNSLPITADHGCQQDFQVGP